MSDSSDPSAESPLDRLRRLAKESTAAKASQRPEVESPVVQPAVEEPVVEEPAPEPAFEEPAFVEPALVEPAFEEPAFEEPAFEEPAFEEPAFVEPVIVEPAAEEPVAEEPVFGVPAAVGESRTEPEPEAPAPEPEPSVEPASRPGPPASARRRRKAEPAAETPPVPAAGAAADLEAPPSDVARQDEPSAPARRLKVLTGVLALLVVLGAVGLVLAILHQRSTADPAKDRAAATAAAIKVVSDTTTLDYRNLDDWLRRVQADSSDGDNPGKGLRSEYANDKANLAAVTASNKSVSVGTVAKSAYCNGYCATSQVAGDTAAALVYGSAKVTSTTTPAGAMNLTGFTVKLVKQNGKWLATNVDPIGVSPTS